MIVKGGPRSGPHQLAIYLMRVERYDTGEPTQLLELQSIRAIGVDANDRERTAAELVEAFRDWQSAVEGTKQGRDGLYHCEISPAPEYAVKMTAAQWLQSADFAGEELGFAGQPRAVVLHAGKDGRPHLHVVWQRTDIETMKVISDSYNYIAHERASHRMEQEFGHEFVPGKHAKRDRKRQEEFPRQKLTQDEDQYQKRTGLSKEERQAEIAALKAASENGPAFKAALEEAGYILAKGDRGYVVVDEKGGQSVLTRNTGLKKKELEDFMQGVALNALPSIEDAKALQAERRKETAKAAKQKAVQEAPQPKPAAIEQPGKPDSKKLKEDIAALKASADSAQAFKAGVEQAGFILANGDRGYTLVDQTGEIYNLARQLKLKLAEVNAYMAAVPRASLPTVEQAQALQSERAQAPSKLEAPTVPEEKGVDASKFLKEQAAPVQPQPVAPPADPELEALKKAIADRNATEVQKWADYHGQQARQLEHELNLLYTGKAKEFDVMQQKEREALLAKYAEQRSGVKGIIDAIQNRWNPQLGADKARERRRELAQLKRRQEKERGDYLALIEQSKQLEMENLRERQAIREHDEALKRAAEGERFIREHYDTKRLREEMEAERKRAEERERDQSLEDGPPPPELGK